MSWEASQAKRVCEACFAGDLIAMKKHADAYLNGGHGVVADLGAPFRNIVRQQARKPWWEKARRFLDAHLSGRTTEREAERPKRKPPDWTAQAGGKEAWAGWVETQASRCRKRGRLWTRKHPGARAPRLAEWTDAIWSALNKCDGRAYYSRWPLSLDIGPAGRDERPWESAIWPSVDHLLDPITPNVVIETRLVNDMKTILGEGEFREVIGHLAHVLGVPAKRLPDGWCCTRSFGVPQRPDEPPLEK